MASPAVQHTVRPLADQRVERGGHQSGDYAGTDATAAPVPRRRTGRDERWIAVADAYFPWGIEYEVSSKGRVRHVVRRTIQTGRLSKGGYLLVDMGRKTFNLHKVVLSSFVAPPHEELEVNHKNRRKNDARLSNLEWLTSGDNKRHAWRARQR